MRLNIPQGSTAGNTTGRTGGIGSGAIITNIPFQPFRKVETCIQHSGSVIENLEHFIGQLDTGKVLGNVIHAVEQIGRVDECCQGCFAKACGNSGHRLPADIHCQTILHLLNGNRQ